MVNLFQLLQTKDAGTKLLEYSVLVKLLCWGFSNVTITFFWLHRNICNRKRSPILRRQDIRWFFLKNSARDCQQTISRDRWVLVRRYAHFKITAIVKKEITCKKSGYLIVPKHIGQALNNWYRHLWSSFRKAQDVTCEWKYVIPT